MAPNDATIEGVIAQITATNNLSALSHTLRNGLPKEAREQILAKPLNSGQDPLAVLDFVQYSLGVLYIISARIASNHPPSWPVINAFCRSFDPEQVKYAPERLTILAQGIQRLSGHDTKLGVEPLYHIVTRYPPTPGFLTPIHPMFLLQCAASRTFTVAIPVLEHPITEIDTVLCPQLTYNDNLTYHYLGGIALAALKKWTLAEEYFEICVTSPGTVPAAIQLEALKKLKLIQLISKGTTSALPKYTHQSLPRLLKNTPYHHFINSYPTKTESLQSILEKDGQVFATEQNLGLVQQALARAPRWSLKKLTRTYVTLGLKDISKAVKIDNEDEVRALILSMIESAEISAQISADGTVTFSDPPPAFSRDQVDKILRAAQDQTLQLEAIEQAMARSKEFISKVVKSRDTEWGAAGQMPMDEDLLVSSPFGGYDPAMAAMGGDYA